MNTCMYMYIQVLHRIIPLKYGVASSTGMWAQEKDRGCDVVRQLFGETTVGLTGRICIVSWL